MKKAVLFGKDGNEGDSPIPAGLATNYDSNDFKELLQRTICEHLKVDNLTDIHKDDKEYAKDLLDFAAGFHIVDETIYNVIVQGDAPMMSDGIQYACEALRKSQLEIAAEKTILFHDISEE
jgi:hypothetical protein